MAAVLSGGSDGRGMILSPTNDASLCRLRARCFLRRHNIHSIRPIPSARDATPATAMPATFFLFRAGLLLATAAVDDVAAGVVVYEKVCNVEV